MSFRVTGVLLIIVMVLGGYMAFRPQTIEDNSTATRPWFYIVEDTDIVKLDVEYYGENEEFIRDETRQWHMGSLEGPQVNEAFSGTPFLAAGARSPRIISQSPSEIDLVGYGLNDPKIKLRVHMVDGRNWQVLIGSLTADRVNNYAQVDGFEDVYLLDRTWGEHMAGLITEPPTGSGNGQSTGQIGDSLAGA
jgi:hypothetical protein